MQRALEDLSLTLDDLRRHLVEAWMRHDADLQRYFSGRTNFFRFDITVAGDQAELCRFLPRNGYRIKAMCCFTLGHDGRRRGIPNPASGEP